jgi:endo-1,4-beta-xylanase
MLALLRRLLGDRVPVHYIGIQAHLSSRDRFSEAGLGRFVREVRELGLVVAVTELDVDDSALPTHPLQRDQLVAATYDRFLRVITTAADIDSVNCWGLSDKSSWLQWHKPRTDGMPQRPLPFDADLKPKAAWDVLKRYLDVAP